MIPALTPVLLSILFMFHWTNHWKKCSKHTDVCINETLVLFSIISIIPSWPTHQHYCTKTAADTVLLQMKLICRLVRIYKLFLPASSCQWFVRSYKENSKFLRLSSEPEMYSFITEKILFVSTFIHKIESDLEKL